MPSPALAASVFLKSAVRAINPRPERRCRSSSARWSSRFPFVALFIAYFAFIPAIPAILLGEILGKRDWLFYALAGAVVAAVVIGM